MSDPEVRVWRRYGNFRLYVSRGEEKVGWYDVRTGAHEVELSRNAEDFWAAVRSECERLGEEVRVPAAAQALGAAAERADTAAEVPGEVPREEDLALNLPGASAGARAAELRGRRPWAMRLARVLGIRTEAGDFAFGAKGERVVGAKLDRWAAKGGWHVLHAVPVGRNGADIDHVLIGPFGVVTINTKATRGRVWVGEGGMVVNGTKVDYLRNSRHEAERTRSLLAKAYGRHVPVQSVIVFVGATKFTVRNGGPRDVAVLPNVRALRRWLRRRGTVLAPEQVSGVYELARRPGSWQR